MLAHESERRLGLGWLDRGQGRCYAGRLPVGLMGKMRKEEAASVGGNGFGGIPRWMGRLDGTSPYILGFVQKD